MMKSEPWVRYFKKTVGSPTIFSSQPRPVVIKNSENSKPAAAGQNNNLPIDVISPLEQSNNMAIAQMKNDKRERISPGQSVSKRGPSSKELSSKHQRPTIRGKKSTTKKTKSGRPKSSITKTGKSAKPTAGKTLTTKQGTKGLVKKLTLTGKRAKDIFSEVNN